MLSIYHYVDASKYIADQWEEKKRRNNSFSIRSWSSQLGLKAHGPLFQMVKGSRAIPKKHVPVFIKSLGLKPKEGLYFDIMVDLQRAKSPELKNMYLERLKSLSPKPILEMVELSNFEILKNPLHGMIIELTSLKDFEYDIEWIQKRLIVKSTKKEIKYAIIRLLQHELLVEEDNTLKRVNNYNFSTKDIKSLALREYHKSVCEIAKNMIESNELNEREYNAMTFPIRKSKVSVAKKLLREFMSDFMRQVECNNGDGEELYHLNLQLMKLTK